MYSKKGFTLLEILIVVALIAALSAALFVAYPYVIKKAKSKEAYINVDMISKTEQLHKFDQGRYVAANNTDEINQILNLSLASKYYEYKVVMPEENSYLVIAQMIGEDIDAYLSAGQLPPEPIVIVMGPGKAGGDYGEYLGSGGGTSGGVTTGGGLVDDLGGGSGGGTGGTSGGGGTTGGGGGTTGGGTGGTGDGSNIIPPPQVYDSDLLGAFNILNGTANGQYFYDLVQRKKISIIYDDFSKYGVFGAAAFWWGVTHNTIYINQELKTTTPESAIASLISHEATHADYDYYPEKRIASTLERHPELTRNDISIARDSQGNELYYGIYDPETDQIISSIVIYNSIDQEYNCFSSQINTWKEIKGSDTDYNNDGWQSVYDQGEDYMKSELRRPVYYGDLPEY